MSNANNMQNLINALSNSKSQEERKELYITIIKSIAHPKAAYYSVLDPRMIIEETSIPYVIKQGNTKKVLLFSQKEFANNWCEHYNVKYNDIPLSCKMTFSEFYKTLAIAVINGVDTLTIDDGQTSIDIFIPDIFNINQISFTENIVMPRLEI